MLLTARRKVLYWALTASVMLMLFGSPTAAQPVLADCTQANATNCETQH